MPVVLQDLPVESGEDLVAQTLIAEVTNYPDDRFGYFISKEETQEREESAFLLFQIILDDVVSKERASLKGLRTAKLSKRPNIESCLIFFTFSAAILR